MSLGPLFGVATPALLLGPVGLRDALVTHIFFVLDVIIFLCSKHFGRGMSGTMF